MGFLFALLCYLGGVFAAMVLIVASIAYIVPDLHPLREPTEISGQTAAKAKPLTSRQVTRRLAERAASR